MRMAVPRGFASIALTAGLLTGVAGPALAQEAPRNGFTFEAATSLSLHKDAVGLHGTYAEDGYIDLGLALRLGVTLQGLICGVGAEGAAMIETPGASYAGLFFGYGLNGPNGARWELTGELGLHGFENVGSAGGNEVSSENHATIPFVGARLTASRPRPTSAWTPGLFLQTRRDLGQRQVTSERTAICHGGIFPDAPTCDAGAATTGYFEVGGFSFEAGFELRRNF